MTDPFDGEKTSGNGCSSCVPCFPSFLNMSGGFPLQQAPAFNAVRTSAMATTSDDDGTR